MAHLWLQLRPRDFDPQAGGPRTLLQEALARHNIRNNPADFAAHCNLASPLRVRSQNLGSALAELGRFAESGADFELT
jgi:hypothetical protein